MLPNKTKYSFHMTCLSASQPLLPLNTVAVEETARRSEGDRRSPNSSGGGALGFAVSGFGGEEEVLFSLSRKGLVFSLSRFFCWGREGRCYGIRICVLRGGAGG